MFGINRLNIRFPHCLSPRLSPKLLRNCLDQPKLNLQRNSESVRGPRHVFQIFFILFRAIILSRGIFRFAAVLFYQRREPADVEFRIIAHYEIIVSKLEEQKTERSH